MSRSIIMELSSSPSKFPMYSRSFQIALSLIFGFAQNAAARTAVDADNMTTLTEVVATSTKSSVLKNNYESAVTSIEAERLRSRIGSAKQLIARSRKLAADAQLLLAASENSKPNFDVEIHETVDRSKPGQPRRMVAPESRAALDNYTNLMARYKTALAAYVQHRQQVQEHATEYHQQAQENQASNAMPPVTSVPDFQALQLEAQDVCFAMQQAEGALHQLELQLFSEIAYLQEKRKLMPAAEYAAAWGIVDGKAVQLQRGAQNFNESVLTKQGGMDDAMHSKMSQAMRDGDYVESQKVYGEHIRNVSIIQAESKRANRHIVMALQFLNELNQLNPNGGSGGSSQAGGGFHFVQDDQSLAAEFEQVQQLYKEVEAAAPKFH